MMKTSWKFLFAVATILLLAGFHAALFAAEKEKPTPPHKRPWVHMSRGACYGTCPVYELNIYPDGEVWFFGEEHVKKPGNQAGQMDPAAVNDLQKAIDASKFFELAEDCCNCAGVTDLSLLIIGINDGTSRKRIEHYEGCRSAPNSISDLESAIDKFSGSKQWVGRVKK